MFHDITIISAEELDNLLHNYQNVLIFIASGSAHIIKRQLLEMGIPEEIMEPFVITNLQISPTPCQFFADKKRQITEVYELLADEKSRTVFISLVNFKITQDGKWLNKIADNEHEQYFDRVMELNAHESFVDCGAYIGDMDEYSQRLDGRWDNYYCFEADLDVFTELNRHVDSCYEDKPIDLYNVGCWDSKTTLYFETAGSGSSSITDKMKDVKIEADSLDHLLADKKVSVIKMDIEGAEQRALAGARQIITTQHPKLTISVYHSLEDFLEIPKLLSAYSDQYKIYLRHYRELTDSETICYAI